MSGRRGGTSLSESVVERRRVMKVDAGPVCLAPGQERMQPGQNALSYV